MNRITLQFAVLISVLFFVSGPAWAYNYAWSPLEDIVTGNPGNDAAECSESNCEGEPDTCPPRGQSPVYVKTGHFTWDATDISLPGRPYLNLTRSYSSHDPRNGLFGNGWISNVERALIKTVKSSIVNDVPVTETYYIFRHQNGLRYTFKVLDDGSLETPKGLFQSIETLTDDRYVFHYPDGMSETYQDGNLILQEDRNGNKIHLSYDDEGLLQQIYDDNNRSLSFFYTANGYVATITNHNGQSWEYEQDLDGNLASVSNPLGGITEYHYQHYSPAYDAQEYYQLTRITDETGRIVTSVSYAGERVSTYTEGENTFTYSFDFLNLSATKQDSQGAQYGFNWNSAGLITRKVDPLGYAVSYSRNEEHITTNFTDKAGNSWAKTVDDLGRVLTSTSPLGLVTSYTYSGENPNPVKVSSPMGHETLMSYDTNYNLITLTNAERSVYAFSYDSKGNVSSVTDALGQTSTITYNSLSLPLSITDPLGRITQYAYDTSGSRISSTDAEGRTFSYSYDELDRVVQTTDGLGNEVHYSYDASGRLLSLTDPAGNITSYLYDTHGRLVEKTLPDSDVISATYRSDNFIDTITQADGKIISFGYDAAKQLTASSIDGGNSISYAYSPTGALTQAQNDQALAQFTYDINGRLTEDVLDGIALTSSYDADGNRATLTYLDELVSYTRNSLGQTTGISNTVDSFTFSYNANGFKTATLFPNGTNEQLSFNSANELTGISSDWGAISYSHDNSGLVTLKNVNGQSTTYGYDAMARLTSSGSDSFNYDVAGNNLQNSSVFNTVTNELTADGDFDYSYDADGNLLSKTNKLDGSQKNYTWNSRNQLLSVKSYNPADELIEELSFTYGPLGRRMTKAVNGVTQTYLYDGMNIVAIMDMENQLVLSTILHGESIDTPLSINTDYQSYYYHRDHQGNILALTDSSQVEVESYSYDAYGVTSHTQDVATNNPYAYTGREFDDEDLYYYRARYYDPTTQRFLSKDPIGFGGGDLNLYRYVQNNPINLIDPWGLRFLVCNRKAGGSTGAMGGNHAYGWDTTSNTGYGMQGSLGSGDHTAELGPGSDECNDVQGSDGLEDPIMDFLQQNADNGVWIPYINDCHNAVADAVESVGLPYPGAPGGRFGPPTNNAPRSPIGTGDIY